MGAAGAEPPRHCPALTRSLGHTQPRQLCDKCGKKVPVTKPPDLDNKWLPSWVVLLSPVPEPAALP